jgi:phosphoribosylamine-glycine ligase
MGDEKSMTLCDVCAAEGYPYDEETCKDCEYNPNREDDAE